ncbi:hypothetical protein FocTR4_00015152 [Fusarium oxysporum f. sp. cubense]|uniref:Knr4/Smi1-like domain-containing protein n=1 Tax=Fusarium oxysporum f. sp. cubense TaxID=61366 RepID=A0A5C6SWW6_FUSOC|nr:hypothetical protein FocTR4_00015152 [Fusarium oxysporum f. sp. cubense]
MATSRPKHIEPEHLRFEFLLRHVDDEPSIADTRPLTEAVRRIIQTAVNFAVVGEVDGATRLLETLTIRGIDPFQYSDFEYPFLKPCMFFAWEATSSWPSWVPEEERAEEKLQELEAEGRKHWLERFSQEWEVTEETAEKALDMAYNGLTTNLPDYNGALARQVIQAEAMAANDEKARELFMKVCDRFHTEEQVEQLACSRAAWKQILAVPERPLLDFLNIHAAKLRPAVSRACQMAENRLQGGPRRRYAGQSIEKLVHIISRNTFKDCPYDRLDAYRPPGNLRDRPRNANALIRRGCYVTGIRALEERLGVTLPEDYKEFLSITNGLDSMWDGQNLVDYLAAAQEVNWQEIDFLEGNELPLLNDGEPLAWTKNILEWPKVEKPRCICLSGDINHEETAGHFFLIGQDLLQPAKDYFFKTYEERDEVQRRELDRLVKETYGSMENFKNLEWGLISWTAWDFTVYPYNGFRDFLEQMAEASLRQERPWLNMFEPRFRKTANMDGA